MTDKKMTGREILIAAMEQYDITYCDEFPPIEAELQFDKECEKNLRKLIRRLNNPFRNYFNTAGRCAAGIAAAILVMICFLAFSKDILTYGERKFTSEFYSYTREDSPDIIYYRFPLGDIESAPKSLRTLFEISYIPEGYELVEHTLNRFGSKENLYYYENTGGEYIIFQQSTLGHGIGFYLPQFAVEEWQYQDIMIVYAKNDRCTYIYWGNYGYTFKLELSSGLSEEECMKIFESVRRVRG